MSTFKNGLINAGFCIITVPDLASKQTIFRSDIIFKDRKLDIKEYRSGKELENQKDIEHKKRIIIKKLPSKIDKTEVRNFFEKFGDIEKFFSLKAEQSKG